MEWVVFSPKPGQWTPHFDDGHDYWIRVSLSFHSNFFGGLLSFYARRTSTLFFSHSFLYLHSSLEDAKASASQPQPRKCRSGAMLWDIALLPHRPALHTAFDNFQEWPRQTKPKKSQFMNFLQGHSGTKVRYVNRACFPKEKHQNSQKWAKFMNFSFWPFFWFGLPGRLLKFEWMFYSFCEPDSPETP